MNVSDQKNSDQKYSPDRSNSSSCDNDSSQISDSTRVNFWQLRTKKLSLPVKPILMGIVNVTPDSFSDGGQFSDPQRAIDHAHELISQGAGIIDIGGESTRPYATAVEERDELERVLPVVQALAEQTDVPISIDTTKSKVASECLAAGAEIINDISGLEFDPEMLKVAVSSKAGVCAMHMQGTPQTMQDNPTYQNIVQEIHHYLKLRRDTLLQAGIDQARICLDPGIGFGKTHQHNLTLLAGTASFHNLGCPLLIGPSRKGFIGKLLGDKELPRINGTIGVCLALASAGAQILRVHDVQAVNEALTLFQATGGIDGFAGTIDG